LRARKRKEEKKNGPGKWAAREERERGEGKRISFFKTLFKFMMHKHLLVLILFK
jgi:hypothetical protein